MRNDAHDEIDNVPSMRAEQREHSDYSVAQPAFNRAAGAAPSASTGPLWALVGALVIALGGLGWWSFQKISLMEQQLVATQESFARISEEASGRIQAITGKVVATESSVTTGSEALKLELKQQANKLAELSRQHESKLQQLAKLLKDVTSGQSEQSKLIEQLAAQAKTGEQSDGALKASLTTLDGALQSLKTEQASLKSGLAAQGKLDERVSTLSSDVDALKKQGNSAQAIARIEQDILVLKSEVETRSASGNSTAEFDAFRAQVTRNISALQAQVQNLQQQINAR